MFYWLFESRNDSANDPLIIWLPGGPGYGSEMAIFYGNGPYTVDQTTNSLLSNPYSWTNNANVLYLDSPVGAGFSTATTYDSTMYDVFNDFWTVLQAFVAAYPQFRGLDLYIAGDSFSGHYIPFIATSLLSQGTVGYNFVGILLGNAFVSYYYQYPSYATYAQANDLINNTLFQTTKAAFVVCDTLIDEGLYSQASTECQATENLITGTTGGNSPRFNWYDIRLNCTTAPLCYNYTFLETFLNRADVQAELKVNMTWTPKNFNVSGAFANDFVIDYSQNVATVLDLGLEVLVYNGDKDFDINWIGAEAWTNALSWTGSNQFVNQSYTDFETYGVYKQYDNLIFLRVTNAGQFVPRDQPAAALAMVEKFIAGWN